MNFYHNLITQKSWDLLKGLRKEYDFILIGGWAVFLYTQALKSKDIDLVCEFDQLEKLRAEFAVSKNDRLKKYQARAEEVEIDVYVPFYSNPGLPAEVLKDYQIIIEGIKTVRKEVLAILKQRALKERANTTKGRKDLIDLVSLFKLADFDWDEYRYLVKQYKVVEYSHFAHQVLKNTVKIEEIEMNVHKFSQFKKKILPLMIKNQV